MTHQDRQRTPQDLPARPKADPIHRRQRTLQDLLAQGMEAADDPESGWVVGLAGQADANFSAVLDLVEGTGSQAFTLSARVPGHGALRPVLLIGPATHAAFRAAIPSGHPGWGWFSASFLKHRGAKAEAWLGVPFLSGRLVPCPSRPPRGGAESAWGPSGLPGEPTDPALARP